MKRTITIVVDDANSRRLQEKPDKTLRSLVRAVADQVSWGDSGRPLVDRDDVTVGEWTLTVQQSAPAATS
jgi:hypothetical protein